MILYTLQLPPGLRREEIEKLLIPKPSGEIEQPRTELEEQEQLEQAIRLSLEAGKIMILFSFLSFSLLKVKLTPLKLVSRHRQDF